MRICQPPENVSAGRWKSVGRESEAAEDRRHLQVDAVAFGEAEAVAQLAVAIEHLRLLGFGRLRRSPIRSSSACISAFIASSGAKARRRLLEHRAPAVLEAVLGQIADGQSRRLDDGAAVGLVQARQHPEQRRLARAVGPAQADALAIVDLPGDRVEQHAVAERLRQGGQLDHLKVP